MDVPHLILMLLKMLPSKSHFELKAADPNIGFTDSMTIFGKDMRQSS
jgi:hypothetical protein